MLYVYCGNSQTRVRAQAYERISVFEEEGVRLTRIDEDSYAEGRLTEASQSSTLFGERMLFLIDTPSSNAAFDAEVKEALEALHASPHVFIVVEKNLLAAEKKKYAKYADDLQEIKEEAHRTFNVFALSDSLARRDKKMLWLGLCEAKQAGLSSEEIIGTLWWQLKTLRLASRTTNAAEAGMKEFPYNKAKRSLSLFKDGDLERLSQSLLAVYHKGHQGETDIELALETWTLTI